MEARIELQCNSNQNKKNIANASETHKWGARAKRTPLDGPTAPPGTSRTTKNRNPGYPMSRKSVRRFQKLRVRRATLWIILIFFPELQDETGPHISFISRILRIIANEREGGRRGERERSSFHIIVLTPARITRESKKWEGVMGVTVGGEKD